MDAAENPAGNRSGWSGAAAPQAASWRSQPAAAFATAV
jgi:hypothetical protein